MPSFWSFPLQRVLQGVWAAKLIATFLQQSDYYLKKGSQHSVTEANDSRLVTKVRWVAEAINGLLKTWNGFNNVFPNSQISYIGDYARIVCAICNAFPSPRIRDNPDDNLIAERML